MAPPSAEIIPAKKWFESFGSTSTDVTSVRLRFGKSSSDQFSPASSLRNSSEFMPPARRKFGFSGSRAKLVAVPPNGPLICQSGTGASNAAARENAIRELLRMMGRNWRSFIFQTTNYFNEIFGLFEENTGAEISLT